MTSTPFNRFHAARALESAGVERSQAEAIASAIGHSGDYATKTDIHAVKSDLHAFKSDLHAFKSDLHAFKSEINARLASLEARMYRALWIQGGAIVAVVTALKLLD